MKLRTRFSMYANSILLLTLFCVFTTIMAQAQRHCMCDGNMAYHSETATRRDALTRVMPVYPDDAVRQGIQGVVEVLIDLDNHGRVARAKINPEIHPLLRRAAGEAIRCWRFRPIQRNPQFAPPVTCTFSFLTFKFVIEDGQGHVELNEIPEGFYTAGRPRGIFTDVDDDNWRSWEDILRSLP